MKWYLGNCNGTHHISMLVKRRLKGCNSDHSENYRPQTNQKQPAIKQYILNSGHVINREREYIKIIEKSIVFKICRSFSYLFCTPLCKQKDLMSVEIGMSMYEHVEYKCTMCFSGFLINNFIHVLHCKFNSVLCTWWDKMKYARHYSFQFVICVWFIQISNWITLLYRDFDVLVT